MRSRRTIWLGLASTLLACSTPPVVVPPKTPRTTPPPVIALATPGITPPAQIVGNNGAANTPPRSQQASPASEPSPSPTPVASGGLHGRVVGPDGQGVADAEVALAGTTTKTKTDTTGAYTFADLAPGLYEVTATGPATAGRLAAVAVRARQVAEAPNLALASTIPVILSITPQTAGPGTRLTLAGKNFGADGAPLTVTVGGVAATDAARLPAGTITATVPAGATSGAIVVTVAGQASTAATVLMVAKLVVKPIIAFMAKGTRQAFTLIATDANGQAVVAPDITISAGTPLEIDGAAVIAKNAGATTLRISTGAGLVEMPITVAAEPVVTTVAGTETDSPLAAPRALALDAAGRVYVAEAGGAVIQRISAIGEVGPFAGAEAGHADGPRDGARFGAIRGLAPGLPDELLVVDVLDHQVYMRHIGDGGLVSTRGTFSEAVDAPIAGPTLGQGGFIYASAGYRIYRAGPGDLFEAFAGNTEGSEDGPRATAGFGAVRGLVADGAGRLFAAEKTRLRMVAADGTVSTLATPAFQDLTSLTGDAAGHLFAYDDGQKALFRVDVDVAGAPATKLAGGPAGFADGPALGTARFGAPALTLSSDPTGRVAIADPANHRIRLLIPPK